MKNTNVRFIGRLLVLMTSLFLLGLTTYAQIGELGIYGSVPEAYRTNTRYVNVSPNDTDNPTVQTLPVNGLKNFNFYYLLDGTGFLPGEHYTVSYLDASQSSLGYEIVNYTPNSGHTNGTQVSTPFNIPQGYDTTPRGLHGRVYARIAGVDYLFPNARIGLVPLLQSISIEVRTNDNGDFYAYYQNGFANAFLPINPAYGYEHYDLIIAGRFNGCSFGRLVLLPRPDFDWVPANASDPSLASYFVTGAEIDVGDIIVNSNGCGDS